MALTSRSSTHSVITSGTQIRSPVMKYRLTKPFFISGGVSAVYQLLAWLALAPLLEPGLEDSFVDDSLVDDSLVAVSLVDDSLAVASLAGPSAPPSFPLSLGFAPLFLKSVAYQPVPFS